MLLEGEREIGRAERHRRETIGEVGAQRTDDRAREAERHQRPTASRQRSAIAACPAMVGCTPSAIQYEGGAALAICVNIDCSGTNVAAAFFATRADTARRSSNSGNHFASTAPVTSTNGSRITS